MKKAFFFSFSLLYCICFWGCSGSKNMASDSAYVPFTNKLKDRILKNDLDLKKVQFFIDQKLILKRSLGTRKVNKSGVLLFENGEYVQEVIIPKYTPGVCDSINGNKLMVSFELQNNDLQFGPGLYTPDYFMLYGRNWTNGVGDLTYDNQTYKVSCGSCSFATEAKLVVKKSQADKIDTKQRVAKGRKVDG